jgi:hypothetical protein
MTRKLFASCVTAVIVLSVKGLAAASPAQVPSDATQVIALAESIAAKELVSSSRVHVTKLALSPEYAIAQWTSGERTGEEIFQKRLGMRWVFMGKEGGQPSTGWLLDYGVPAVTATALVAGIEDCANPQRVTFHGSVTAVCLIGPGGVC